MQQGNNDLSVLRARIDDLDEQMLELLKARMTIVREVGHLKAKTVSAGLSFIRPAREALMIRALIAKMDRDFPPAAIATMWRMIISASLTLEQSMTIAAFCKKNSQAPYWLAREYFGTVMPIARFTEEELVVEQVIKSYATIGILPLEQQMEKPWWLRPAGESNQIFIFAKLPYVVQSWMADDENAFAIAAVMPEETGDDISVLAIETFAAADEVIANLQRVYAADILLLSQAENGLLIGVSCFLDSALLAQKTLGSAVRLLGAYARPLQFSEKDSIS